MATRPAIPIRYNTRATTESTPTRPSAESQLVVAHPHRGQAGPVALDSLILANDHFNERDPSRFSRLGDCVVSGPVTPPGSPRPAGSLSSFSSHRARHNGPRVVSRQMPGPPDQVRWVPLAATRGSRDEAVIIGRTLYLHTPDGSGTSELA